MIDIDALKRDKRPQSAWVVHALIDRLEAAESEALEEARLNGMGSEREAALMAKLEAAEKERDDAKAAAENIALKLDYLRSKLETAKNAQNDWLRANAPGGWIDNLRIENEALRAKVARMEKQESVATVIKEGDSRYWMSERLWTFPDGKYPLYALPGAQGEEKMKLSEKIQEALREQQEINLSDPAVQKRLAAQWGYVPAEAQPAPSVPMDVIADYLVSISAHLARRDDAKAQAEIGELLKMIASAPKPGASVPEDVMRDAERYRYLRARDDGTAGVGCWIEAEGRACDRGWLYGDQLDSAIDTCIEMLAAAPEAKP